MTSYQPQRLAPGYITALTVDGVGTVPYLSAADTGETPCDHHTTACFFCFAAPGAWGPVRLDGPWFGSTPIPRKALR